MASSGDKVYPTPAQLRSVGKWVQVEGLVAGLDYDEGYDANELVTSSTIALSITEESAQEVGHAVEDLSIELQVPTVNSDLFGTVHHTFAGLNIAHRVDVSIYGPHPALTHADWVGAGGASTPNANGEFTVIASGTPTLTLTIPNNFEQIQADAPLEDFPVGGPVVPLSYWYHKADIWADSYGAAKPSGPAWDATWEGVYCWRGWPWLAMRLQVPEESQLRLYLSGYRLASVTDNHYAGVDWVTGENRQNGFSCTWASWQSFCLPHIITYDDNGNPALTQSDAVPKSDDVTVYWRVPLTSEGVDIDPEVVTTVVLTGMADGAWQFLDDPKLVLDPTAETHCVIKVFEAAAKDGDEHHTGVGYRKGGISAVADQAHWRALYWGDSDNANIAEDCGGIFDRLISANWEIDYTTAWTLAQFCNLITNCSDAWNAVIRTEEYDAALKDADDNEIPVWAFDIREAQDPAPTAPLEQDVDAGTATVAIRCGSWTVAPGVVCPIVTDKVIGGRIHGVAYDEEYALQRSTAQVATVLRRGSANEWEFYEHDDSDDAARWRTRSLQEFIPVELDPGDDPVETQTPYSWGVAETGGSTPEWTFSRAPHREYLRLSVPYVQPGTGIGFLHCTYNSVAAVAIVTDAGLRRSVGIHKLRPFASEGQWSDRRTVPSSSGVLSASTHITPSRDYHVLIENKRALTRLRSCRGLDGNFDDPVTLSGITHAFAEWRDTKLEVVARREDGHYLIELAAPKYIQTGDPVRVLANSADSPASIVRNTDDWALYAAVPSGEVPECTVALLGSRDAGQTWSELHSGISLNYPVLWYHGGTLWLVGYIDGETEGAQGRVALLRYDARQTTLPAVDDEPIVVGPSDQGRPAVFVHPALWAGIILAPKSRIWQDTPVRPAIVEYVSMDNGQTWARRQVVEI